MINPQQDVYNTVFNVCAGLADTYEKLPSDTATYPFISMGETQLVANRNMTAIFANVFQTLDFYASDRQRGTLSELMFNAEKALRNIKETNNQMVDVINVTVRVLTDTSTNNTLYHGILELEFKLY
jgi:hypothetical protein